SGYIQYDSAYFFFQAEDGIRDWSVTGVQTCALPICRGENHVKLQTPFPSDASRRLHRGSARRQPAGGVHRCPGFERRGDAVAREIGRASCREREEVREGRGALRKKQSDRLSASASG